MPKFICVTCGTQYPDSAAPPAHCLICEDERQYINRDGQQWTTLDQLRPDHHNTLTELEPGLTAIVTEPKVAIGQRALLVQSSGGNVLWDCISYIDDATVEAVNALGGVSAIAISHPHFYSSMVEWSRAFGDVPILLHESNRQYVMQPSAAVQYWQGETYTAGEGITLVRCGGHFEGSTVLHWQAGAGGRGALLTADTLYVVADTRYVSFMYSYPNYLPLPATAVERIVAAVARYEFERLYSAWHGAVISQDAKNAVKLSAARYIQVISGARHGG